MLSVLDQVLDRFESRYADVFTRLDRLVAVTHPTRAELDEFTKTIPHTPQVLDYFFARLTSSGWFPGLMKRGAFDDPPAPVEDLEQGTVSFPGWPAAVYLRRMADGYPEEVSQILTSLRTTNPRVQDQAVEVALELSVRHAVATAPRIQEWIPGMVSFRFFGEPVVALANRLASSGEGSAAAALVRALLAPPEPQEPDGRMRWTREEVPYHLGEGAKELFSKLAPVLGAAVVELIGEPLERRLGADGADVGTEHRPEEPLGVRDHSTVWLPHVGSVPSFRSGEMLAFLALHLRRVLDELVGLGIPVSDVAAALRQRRTLLFRRIELDFIAGHAAAASELARLAVLDRRLFDEPEVRAEYAVLVASVFGLLKHDEQEQFLGWVAEGRDFLWEPNESLRRAWRESQERGASPRSATGSPSCPRIWTRGALPALSSFSRSMASRARSSGTSRRSGCGAAQPAL
jgi:hypothetical protein